MALNIIKNKLDRKKEELESRKQHFAEQVPTQLGYSSCGTRNLVNWLMHIHELQAEVNQLEEFLQLQELGVL